MDHKTVHLMDQSDVPCAFTLPSLERCWQARRNHDRMPEGFPRHAWQSPWMPDAELVERVARALGNASISGDPFDDVELHQDHQDRYLEAARRIVEGRY